jgi:hypothetical protein
VEREPEDNADHLTFCRALEKLDAKGLKYEHLGDRVAHVTTSQGSLYLIRSIEVYTERSHTHNKQGVVIVGYDGRLDNWIGADTWLSNTMHAAQDDKIAKILEAAEGKRRVLIIGDSKEDAAVIPELRHRGYQVDFIYVQKVHNATKIHPDATVAITRQGYQRLYSLIQPQQQTI